MTLHDVLASIVTVLLISAVIALTALGRPVPALLTASFGTAVGYVFRGAVDGINGRNHTT